LRRSWILKCAAISQLPRMTLTLRGMRLNREVPLASDIGG
jgi:hypothetical protein